MPEGAELPKSRSSVCKSAMPVAERWKSVGIALVFRDQLRQHVRAVVVAGGPGIDAPLDAEQAEFGKGRPFELLVGEDLSARGMIDREQPDLIQIGHLAQLFGDADVVAAIPRLKRRAGDLHVFL